MGIAGKMNSKIHYNQSSSFITPISKLEFKILKFTRVNLECFVVVLAGASEPVSTKRANIFLSFICTSARM